MKIIMIVSVLLLLPLKVFSSEFPCSVLVWQMCYSESVNSRTPLERCPGAFKLWLEPEDQNYETVLDYSRMQSNYQLEDISHLGESLEGKSLAGNPKAFQQQLVTGMIYLIINRKNCSKGDDLEGLPAAPKVRQSVKKKSPLAKKFANLKASVGPSRGGKHILTFKVSAELKQRREANRRKDAVVEGGCGWFGCGVRKKSKERRR